MSGLLDRVPDYVRSFESYTPSRPDPVLMRQYGLSRLYRLNNNENALGPPPAAREALAGFPPERAAVYPSGDSYFLREALAGRHGKDRDRFLVGNGSTEIITAVIKALCGPGDAIVAADKTFAVYEWVGKFSGVETRLVPLRGPDLLPDDVLAAVNDRTRIVFLCNPNNPTGSWWDREALERFLVRLGGRAFVVLDEAYCEFMDDPAFPDGMEVMERHDNVLVFRTFSKMYGLAALRVGYLCGSLAAVDVIRRTHLAYSVNTPGQFAAAAALEGDAGHIRDTRAMVAAARTFLEETFAGLGLECYSRSGNYLMVRVPVSDTLLYRRLMREGVMIRTMTGFRFPNWIRVSLGLEEAMAAFAAGLRKVLDRP